MDDLLEWIIFLFAVTVSIAFLVMVISAAISNVIRARNERRETQGPKGDPGPPGPMGPMGDTIYRSEDGQ